MKIIMRRDSVIFYFENNRIDSAVRRCLLNKTKPFYLELVSEGSLWHRTKIAITVLSIMITWALENAIETADSMKSRGYGLKGRTAFSIYRFDDRDKAVMGYLGFCGVYLLCGMMVSAFGFRYFPSIRYVGINPMTLSFQFVYLILCLMPVVLNYLEERKWKAIHSNM